MARNPNSNPNIMPDDLRGTISTILTEDVFCYFEPEITRIAGRHDPSDPANDKDGIFDDFERINNDNDLNFNIVKSANDEFRSDAILHCYPEREQALEDFRAAAERLKVANDISSLVGEHRDAARYEPVLGADQSRKDHIKSVLRAAYGRQANTIIEDVSKGLVEGLDSLIYNILDNPADLDVLIDYLKSRAETDLWDGVTPVVPSIPQNTSAGRIGKSPSEIGLNELLNQLIVLSSGPGRKVPREAGVEHPWGLHTSARNHRKQMRQGAIMSKLEEIGQTLTVRKKFLNAEKSKIAFEWLMNTAPPIQVALVHPIVIDAIDDLNVRLGALWTPAQIEPFMNGPLEQELKKLKLIP